LGKSVFVFTDTNFKTEALESNVPVVVDFWAEWCGPCKAISPTIEEIASELDGKAKIGKVNVDDNPEIANNFNVLNIPTLIFIKGGKEMGRMVGINPKAEILRKIEALAK